MSLPKYLTVLFFLLLMLSLRFLFFYRNLPQYRNGQSLQLTTTLTEEPQVVSGKQKFSLQDDHGVKINITTTLGPFYQYGDRLELIGKLKMTEYKGRTVY